MNSYSVKISYEDREKGRGETTVKVDATTIAGGIAKAAREFIKGLDRKQRFDANKGLQIEAARVTTAEADKTESAKGTTA
jgi:lysine/ornithine N-monooxygenase